MILGTMADIWGGIGVSIGDSKGDWFYRLNHEIRGPVGYQALVDKLLAGEINLTTEVSRDGATYFPLAQVKAFAPHLEEASHTQVRRITRRSNLRLALLTVPVLAALVALAVVLKHNYAHHQKESQQAAKLALAKAQPPSPESLSKLHLVALVSLGTESDVKITNTGAGKHLRHGKKRKHTKNADGPGPVDDYEPEETVSTCQLTQQDIFGTLRNQLNKLNVCVEDEKKRDTEGLLPGLLELQFIVKANGRVTEFYVGDRHYRVGPLNNCLVKVFNSIEFPSSNGANCPVTIPIKISK